MKKILVTVFVIILFAIGYIYATPYLVMKNIREEVVAQNIDGLSQYIDYDSVRTHLGKQLKTAITAQFVSAPEMQNNPFSDFAMVMIPGLVDRLTEVLISPEAIGALFKGENVKKIAEHQPTITPPSAEQSSENNYSGFGAKWNQAKTGYESFSWFVVEIPNDEGKVVKFRFRREGLIEWKLNEIVLPFDFLN
ncbi:DUF2939 domain-containing protein [Neisseria sp. Ec49-e6-T10]|uniref:DUF2939 domain-containing protein n=1 Tax=Neisseria sp. Ec49-e6-T10 TaxID=3140744 RepID=UPI003EBB90DD